MSFSFSWIGKKRQQLARWQAVAGENRCHLQKGSPPPSPPGLVGHAAAAEKNADEECQVLLSTLSPL